MTYNDLYIYIYVPIQRMTLCEIIEDEWFQMEYEPAKRIDFDQVINLDDVHAAFDGIEVILK